MSRSSGSGLVLDLSSQGATAVTITPGAGVQPVDFTLPAPKFDARGNYPRATRIVVKCRATITAGTEGSSSIQWDKLAKAISSFRSHCPLMGTIHDPLVFTGPVTKHLAEFVCNGYTYYGPINDGITGGETQIVDLYFVLPFANEAFFSPLDFAPWVGWLTQLQLQVNVASSAVFDADTSGATLDSVTLSAWIEAVPTKVLELPSINQWRVYLPAAAGGSQALLQDVGGQGGLTCVIPGTRLAGIYECTSVNGMGGAALATAYTSFACDQLSQPTTFNVDSFVAQYYAARRQSVVGGRVTNVAGTLTPMTNMAGNPRNMAGGASASDLFGLSPDLMFIPWRTPGADAEIGSQPKFQGNMTLQRTFTAAPSSGQFPIVTNEIRQLSAQASLTFLQAANVDQSRINGMQKAYYDGRPQNAKSGFGIPVRVPNH